MTHLPTRPKQSAIRDPQYAIWCTANAPKVPHLKITHIPPNPMPHKDLPPSPPHLPRSGRMSITCIPAARADAKPISASSNAAHRSGGTPINSAARK